jgi:hypothetical protein
VAGRMSCLQVEPLFTLPNARHRLANHQACGFLRTDRFSFELWILAGRLPQEDFAALAGLEHPFLPWVWWLSHGVVSGLRHATFPSPLSMPWGAEAPGWGGNGVLFDRCRPSQRLPGSNEPSAGGLRKSNMARIFQRAGRRQKMTAQRETAWQAALWNLAGFCPLSRPKCLRRATK